MSGKLRKNMGERKFRRRMGEYWNFTLNSVSRQHRRLVVDGVRRVEEVNDRLAEMLALESVDILKAGGEEGYEWVCESLIKIASKDYWSACNLSVKSASILNEVGMEGYEVIADSIYDLIDKSKKAASSLAYFSANLFAADSLNIKEYKMLSDGLYKAVDESENYTVDLVKRIGDVIDSFKDSAEFSRDLFLVKSVRDQRDAGIISDLVDLDNPGISKEYDKKVGSLF